ncbi:MAG TPA: hypothetical protein P5548_02400 [Candidatus Moranbacteria bacterium]|nr:hypothetical protein [Candidatus Moranbacteria bacterium]HRZ33719.1 hypothetical protein [Candidatus Moranbacteria bacterium]
MDIISHGLYGGIAFGRKNAKDYIKAFLIGISPDIFSFGIFMAARILGFAQEIDFSKGHMDQSLIPGYVHILYGITHSLIIFFATFFAVWLIRKKPYWILGAWGLHILIDIPSHSFDFFPTPFLWPISDFMIDGIGWGNPIIFFPNVAILVIVYAIFLYKRQKNKIRQTQ